MDWNWILHRKIGKRRKIPSFYVVFHFYYWNQTVILDLYSMFKKILSGYFSFSKKERRGILFLLGAILLFTLFPFFFPFLFKGRVPDHRAFEKDIARLKLLENDSNDRRRQSNPGKNYYRSFPSNKENKYIYPLKPEVTLFNFDPNTLDAGGWKKLGIRERTISTLQLGGSLGTAHYIFCATRRRASTSRG